MENDPNKETLLARWLSGDLSSEEQKELAEDKSLDALKVVTDDISNWQLPPMDLNNGLKKLKAELSDEETKTVSIQPFGYVMRIAAAVTLLVVGYIGWQYYFDGAQKFRTGIAERLDVTLPDQSLAMLDARSVISYDESSWEKERKLNLKGQAYFDVTKGSTFTVETNAGSVTVLGTEFNVKHYRGTLAVTCYEGSVRVESGNDQVILEPSEGVSFIDGEMNRYETDDTQPDWQQGYTRFSGALLIRVVAELKRRFEAEIKLPEKYHGLKYTGAVPFTSLEEALQSVFVPMELDYEIGDNGIVTVH